MTSGGSGLQVRRPQSAPHSAGRSARVRRVRLFQAELFGAIAILIVVVSVALWTRGGGIQAMTGRGGPATSVGRLAGLTASALLLLQVLLMARIPWVESAWGQDVLARRHRWVGFCSFHLMLGHVVLITLGYAQSGRSGVLAQSWTMLRTYPGMLLAAAGTVALVVVVVTSLRAARRRLRYESWHLLHLYAYLGVGLALPHQLWTGHDFTSSTTATTFWWGLWAIAAGTVILYRLVLPLSRSVWHGITVAEVVEEGPGVISVIMTGRRLHRVGWQAGQFCQWRFLSGSGWSRAHPLSISAMPSPERIRITARLIGNGSHRLAGLAPGTRVLFEGPYGSMTPDRRRRRDVLMICAGIGITPMRALAEHLVGEGASFEAGRLRRPSVTILHRVQSVGDCTFAAEFGYLARNADLTVLPLVGRRADGSSIFPGPGSVDAERKLTSLVPGLIQREVYLCGPKTFMREARRSLESAGVPAIHIHAEEFGW